MVGRKDDSGKLRMDLIPSEPIEALATILTHGAAKYDDNNWMKGLPFRRVYAAMLRHLLAYRRGEYIDHDSGHPHLWHAFCNLAFLIYYNHPDHYARYDEFNNFKKEWAQKLDNSEMVLVEKNCDSCKYLNHLLDSLPCTMCFSWENFPLWEPKVVEACSTCFYNGKGNPACFSCSIGMIGYGDLSNWEPKESIPVNYDLSKEEFTILGARKWKIK